MNNHQIASILRSFAEALDHDLPPNFADKIAAEHTAGTATTLDQFMQALTECGHRGYLVFLPNRIAADDYDDFVQKLSFPVLTFYRSDQGPVPVVIRLDKKLQPIAYRIRTDGTPESIPIGGFPSPYQDDEGQVPFMTAFPFRSIVSEAEASDEPLTPMKRLLTLLGTERRDIIYLYVYAIAVGIISLSLPLGTQAIVSFIAGGMWLNSVVLLIALVVIGIVVVGGLQIMQIYMVEIMQRRIFAKTAFEFAYRIPRIDAEALNKYYAPELINRFFDILTIQKGLPKLLIDLSTAVIQIFFSLILLSFYHPFFVFFGLLLVTILVVIFYVTGAKGLDSSITESKYKYKVAYWLEELARTLSSFKVAGTTQLPVQRANEHVNNYLVQRKIHFGVLIRQFSYIIAFKTLIVGGVLVLGTILVINRQITLGQFVASEIIIVLILGAVEKIIVNMDTIYDMLTAVDKIGHVTDLPLEREEGITVPSTYFEQGIDIRVEGLSYRYPNSKDYVLKDINLRIKPGERVCITGYNGSGKSTLVSILDGIYGSYEGIVTLNNVSLQNLDLSALRDHIAKNVSQEDIFDGTVLDNVTVGKPFVNYQMAIDALAAVGILDDINRMPQGLDTPLISGGKNLSTGLVNKIILARCIAKNPQVIILNDFFQFFSKPERTALIAYLTEAQHTWSLVIVSSDPVILSQCTKVVVLQAGEKVLEGTYDEVKENEYFQKLVYDEAVSAES